VFFRRRSETALVFYTMKSPMKTLRQLLLPGLAAGAVIVTLAAAVFAQKVKVDYDKTVECKNCSKYAWVEGKIFPAPMTHAYMVSAVDEEMGKKGWHKVDPRDAQALITYNAAFSTDLTVSGFLDPTYAMVGGEPLPTGGSPLSSAGSGVGSTSRYLKKGTLGLELYRKEDGQLLWNASAEGTAKEDRSKRMKQLDNALEKMLAQLPAAAK
jgi:hypothetical protein